MKYNDFCTTVCLLFFCNSMQLMLLSMSPKLFLKGKQSGYKHNIGHIELEDQKLSENSGKICIDALQNRFK